MGVERAAEDIPIVSNAYGSVAAGTLLLATGALLTRLGGWSGEPHVRRRRTAVYGGA